ncbi:N-acetyltransferase [Acerihabitans sp.]|uniref:GNAT family N-acetyltransferase n=1 Tax=Acerihabitans sp. TaxID=2811394 RepID=UPI002EDB09FB
MLIRVEIPVDAPGIDSLLRRAFGRDAEAELIRRLREDGLLTLGVVATDEDGGVIGYAAFSPVWIGGEDCQWVGLAPLAVDADFRRQGIARQLIYEGLDTLNEFGYRAVVVLGAPDYYSRLGFIPAARSQLHCRWPGAEAAFQLFTLADDALEGVSGQVVYAEPFDQLAP